MSLTAGAMLGPYEILALIGKGGMGEVYRARDARLNRDVAVKVSRQEFGERFQREARVVASLNHPNICHLYDVGPNYLVMELVEGPTLAERIEERPLIEPEAYRIASQIAEALAAAHEKGVVHRDLKPANVKIRADGTVKVLDFGLAKLAVPVTEDSPTVSLEATKAGAVLGTAAYMSPEQAKGEPVDKRADIWSFGVVVYEMLAGRRLFKGSGMTETLAAVIEREPEWGRVPARARPMLRRCLAKDSKKRLHDIADAMPLLDLVPETAAPAGAGKSRLLTWMVGVAALALAAAAAATFLYLRERASTVPPQQVRFRIPAPGNGKLGSFAVSPDGRQLAFIAASNGVSHLWLRKLDSLESRLLPDTEGTNGYPFWSPDSRFVVFVADKRLKKIDSSGGSPQSLCDVPAYTFGGSWSPDNVILLGTKQGIQRVSANGGTLSPLTQLGDGDFGEGVPTFLPDGRHFLYFKGSDELARTGVWIGSLDATPQEQPGNRLIATPDTFRYVPSADGYGHVFFLRGGSLVTQAFDEGQLQLTGEAVPLVNRVAEDGGTSFFTVSHSGALIYLPGQGGDASLLTWYDRGGKILGTVGEAGDYGSSILSPDGKFAAVTQGGDVWIVDLTRSTNQRLTTSRSVVGFAAWSPDRIHVAYTASPGGVLGIYQMAMNGGGGEQLLWKADLMGLMSPAGWSPDGRFLSFVVNSPKTLSDVWMLPLLSPGGDRKPFPLLQSEFQELGVTFSPDGKWFAYRSNRSGKDEIDVRPFDPEKKDLSLSGGETLVSKGGAAGAVRWRSDQKEFYYLAPDGKIMAVEMSTGTPFRVGEPKLLFQAPPGFMRGVTPSALVDVTPDGKQFLLAVPVAHSADDDGLTVVLNWQASLTK